MLHQDEKIGEKQRSQACNCKSTITANSHTILTVLLKHPDVCEYHNCIGQTLQAYITRVRSFASFHMPRFNKQDSLQYSLDTNSIRPDEDACTQARP